MRPWISCILLLGLGWPVVVLPSEGDWKTVRSEDNRFVVNGLDPAVTQDLAIWMEQTHQRLRRHFQLNLSFNPLRPFVVVLHPDTEEATLFTAGRGQRLEQELWVPDGNRFDGDVFAERFIEAMLYRFIEQNTPGEAARAEVPLWLARGLAAEFIPGRRGDLRARGLERWKAGRLNPPYTLTIAAGVEEAGDRIDQIWAVSFLFSTVSDPNAVWSEILRSGLLTAEWWRNTTGAQTLRGVHLAWEVWMADRSRRFLSDRAAATLFRDQLNRDLVFRPGEFGFDGESVPREKPLSLMDLSERLDDSWVFPLLNSWITRMSLLRFGQRGERLVLMDQYLEAAETLRDAARRRGSRRETALERFQALYSLAEDFRKEWEQSLLEPDRH